MTNKFVTVMKSHETHSKWKWANSRRIGEMPEGAEVRLRFRRGHRGVSRH